MAWLDERIWCHPKVTDLSDKAFRAYINGIAYSAGFETAGRLTTGQQRIIGASAREKRELLKIGLWHPIDNCGSIDINDWDEHNAKRDARKKADRERKREHRKSKGQSGGTSAGQSAGRSAGQSAGASTGTARVEGVKSDRVTDEGQEHEGSSVSANMPAKPAVASYDAPAYTNEHYLEPIGAQAIQALAAAADAGQAGKEITHRETS